MKLQTLKDTNPPEPNKNSSDQDSPKNARGFVKAFKVIRKELIATYLPKLFLTLTF